MELQRRSELEEKTEKQLFEHTLNILIAEEEALESQITKDLEDLRNKNKKLVQLRSQVKDYRTKSEKRFQRLELERRNLRMDMFVHKSNS